MKHTPQQMREAADYVTNLANGMGRHVANSLDGAAEMLRAGADAIEWVAELEAQPQPAPVSEHPFNELCRDKNEQFQQARPAQGKGTEMQPTNHLKAEPIEHPILPVQNYISNGQREMQITGYRILQWWSEDGSGPDEAQGEMVPDPMNNTMAYVLMPRKGQWRYLDGCEP